MINFKTFLIESTPTRHDLGGGHVVYHHQVGDHHIQTHFIPRHQNGKVVGHDVHFTREKKGGRANPSSRAGASKMTSSDRVRALSSVRHAVHHFIKNDKPQALHADANTKRKGKVFGRVMQSIAKKHGGSIHSSGKSSVVKF